MNPNGTGPNPVARGIWIEGDGVATSKNVTIQNSTFGKVAPRDDGDCIVIQDATDYANLQVLHNSFNGCTKRAVKVQVPGAVIANNTIVNPFLSNNPYTPYVTGEPPFGTFDMYSAISVYASNVAVSGNVITGAGSYYNAIELGSGAPLTNVSVQGNNVQMGSGAGANLGTPSSFLRAFSALDELTITNNTFSTGNAANTVPNGIRLDPAVTRPTIKNNTMTNVTTAIQCTSACQAPYPPSLAIPAYFYPGAPWTQLVEAAPIAGLAVINPNNGPGAAVNADYANQVTASQSAGVTVFGYVYTRYANTQTDTVTNGGYDRTIANVEADIAKYLTWYHVDGIFLDEATNTCDAASLTYYTTLVTYIKEQGGKGIVALNPGTATGECYLTAAPAADIFVTFEGHYSDYLSATAPPAWVSNYSPSRFWHLVYDAPDIPSMQNAVSLAIQRGAGWVYVTPNGSNGSNPWGALPADPYWSDELATVQPAPQLDQQSPFAYNGSGYYTVANGTQLPAETFTAGLTGSLDQVDVYVSYQSATAGPTGPGDLIVQVRSVDPATGNPNAVLGSVTVPQTQTNTWSPMGWHTITLGAGAVPVAAGGQYALVLTSSQPGGSYNWALSDWSVNNAPDTYPGGYPVTRNQYGVWDHSEQNAADFIFRTYVTPFRSGAVPPPASPTISGIGPDTAAAGATAGVPLTINGSGFTNGATVQWSWNGQTTSLPASVQSGSQLSTTIPVSLLSAAGVASVSVLVGGAASNQEPFYITNSGTTVSASAAATGSGTVTATAGGISASATSGSGSVAVAQYTANPAPASNSFSGNGVYFDVHIATGSTFTSVTVQDCATNGGTRAYWYDPVNGWTLVSNQTYTQYNGCISITANSSGTSPTIAQLTGTYFAFAKATPVITWAPPADIIAGTALSSTQLNAAANVPGTFVYTPPAGTVLPPGSGQTLSVSFTPTDGVVYSAGTAKVTINVHYTYAFLPPLGNIGGGNNGGQGGNGGQGSNGGAGANQAAPERALTFETGQTIPVKFALANAQGTSVNNATATLTANGKPAADADGHGGGKGVPVPGNQFHFQGNHYQFNLSTKGMTAGPLVLAVTLDDGTTHSVTITLVAPTKGGGQGNNQGNNQGNGQGNSQNGQNNQGNQGN